MSLHVYSTLQELSYAAATYIAQLSAEVVAARGRFIVALSGGSLPKILSSTLAAEPLRSQIDWSAWHVCWADERCLPPTHPDSNYAVAKEYLFDHVPIPPSQIYNPDTSLTPAQTAAAYQNTLVHLFNLHAKRLISNLQPPITTQSVHPSTLPPFDLILLGLGEDGHTASLFPGHPLLNETERWVAPIFDSPKPPPERITLTLPVINNARTVIFIAAGAGKADALAEIFGANESRLPAELVKPASGELRWFVDEAAAAGLNR
ncbi:MAG: 6-phosphogluconolactonase [Anaerolineae bacterium]